MWTLNLVKPTAKSASWTVSLLVFHTFVVTFMRWEAWGQTPLLAPIFCSAELFSTRTPQSFCFLSFDGHVRRFSNSLMFPLENVLKILFVFLRLLHVWCPLRAKLAVRPTYFLSSTYADGKLFCLWRNIPNCAIIPNLSTKRCLPIVLPLQSSLMKFRSFTYRHMHVPNYADAMSWILDLQRDLHADYVALDEAYTFWTRTLLFNVSLLSTRVALHSMLAVPSRLLLILQLSASASWRLGCIFV